MTEEMTLEAILDKLVAAVEGVARETKDEYERGVGVSHFAAQGDTPARWHATAGRAGADGATPRLAALGALEVLARRTREFAAHHREAAQRSDAAVRVIEEALR